MGLTPELFTTLRECYDKLEEQGRTLPHDRLYYNLETIKMAIANIIEDDINEFIQSTRRNDRHRDDSHAQ